MFFRDVWVSGKKERRCIGTADRDEAERLGRMLCAELLRQDGAHDRREPFTLAALWRRYSRECAEFLDNKDRTRRDAATRARILLGYFGEEFCAEELTIDHQRRYERARVAGGITTTNGEVTRPTRNRSAEADVVLLHTMLRWATTVRLPGGAYLLDRHPLLHVRRVREKNRKQPAATWERFQATVDAMRELGTAAATDAERVRWKRMELALFLAEQTGRRLGSIRQLRWEDFVYDRGLVHWRAEADKKGYKWEVPMPAAFFDEVRRLQRELGAIGGPLFEAPNRLRRRAGQDHSTRDCIMDRHLFDKWLGVAEQKAELAKLDGSMWHAYRRKWAIERKHLPLRDVAAAGGWKDVNTLLEIYQQPDEESVLAVTSETRKLRERGVTASEPAEATARQARG